MKQRAEELAGWVYATHVPRRKGQHGPKTGPRRRAGANCCPNSGNRVPKQIRSGLLHPTARRRLHELSRWRSLDQLFASQHLDRGQRRPRRPVGNLLIGTSAPAIDLIDQVRHLRRGRGSDDTDITVEFFADETLCLGGVQIDRPCRGYRKKRRTGTGRAGDGVLCKRT